MEKENSLLLQIKSRNSLFLIVHAHNTVTYKILSYIRSSIKKRENKRGRRISTRLKGSESFRRGGGGAKIISFADRGRSKEGGRKGPAWTINIAGDKISRNKKGSLEVDARHPKEH